MDPKNQLTRSDISAINQKESDKEFKVRGILTSTFRRGYYDDPFDSSSEYVLSDGTGSVDLYFEDNLHRNAPELIRGREYVTVGKVGYQSGHDGLGILNPTVGLISSKPDIMAYQREYLLNYPDFAIPYNGMTTPFHTLALREEAKQNENYWKVGIGIVIAFGIWWFAVHNHTATAICSDGTTSYSAHHSGTCSDHGGVQQWVDGSQSDSSDDPSASGN